MCNGLIDFKRLDPATLAILQEKMSLEQTFKPEVNKLFNRMLRDFQAMVIATGQSPDARIYRQEWDGILRNHYERVQRSFNGNITDSIEGKIIRLKQSREEDRDLEALITASFLAWRVDSGVRESQVISNTNQHQMQTSITRARQQVTEAQLPTDNRTLAAIAVAFLRRLFKARTERIIVTETQSPAEAARAIEATALAGGVPFPLERVQGVEPAVPRRIVTKTWRDIGDNAVRDTHVRVDGTTIPENEVFTVGISRLRFPGDMLLGAATKEVINCRCFADYRLIRG